MTIFPHALGGAVSATFTDNYLLAFIFGFISHFILDITPHLDPKFLATKEPDGTKKWSIWLYVFVTVEAILTILFFTLLYHRINLWIVITGAIGGIFPDVIVNNPFLQFMRNKPLIKYFFIFHDKIHLELPAKFWPINVLMEIIVIGGSICYLLKS
jgi:hypothetical protein